MPSFVDQNEFPPKREGGLFSEMTQNERTNFKEKEGWPPKYLRFK